MARPLPVQRQHVAEHSALFDCVIERYVSVGHVVEPAFGHVAFDGVSVGDFQHCGGVAFDVEG